MNTPDNAIAALCWYYAVLGMLEEHTNILLDQVLASSDLMTFEFPDDVIDGSITEKIHVSARADHIDLMQKEASVHDRSRFLDGAVVRYKCNLCNKTYASTDGIAKHYRKRHTEVVRMKGKPRKYCVAVASSV